MKLLPWPLLCIAGALLPALLSHAQQGTDRSDEENVFVLPEFVVAADRGSGYQATNSLTGTFLDTPLKDSPFAIDVFMPDLIADTGSTDMREILAYDSGLQLDNTIGGQTASSYTMGTEFDSRSINNNETDIVTRGFRAPTLKNGFFTKTRVDTVNIARVERAGGPQSLLYGIGSISGITNVITKRPLPAQRSIAEFFVGSHDFQRATLETTGPLLKRDTYSLGYIATVAGQTEGTEYPHEKNETFFISPGLELRAFDNKTNLFVNLEQGWRKQSGTGFNDIEYPFPSPNDPPFPYGAIDTGGGAYQRQTGDTPTYLRDFLGLGNYTNLGGPDAFIKDDVLSASLEFTQRIGDHFRLLVAGNRERQFRDQREYTLSGGRFIYEAGSSDPIDEYIIYAFGDSWDDRVTEQARIALLGSFELWGGIHSFVVGRQEISERRNATEFPEGSILETDGAFQTWPFDGSPVRYQGEPLTPPRWENFFNEWYQGHYALYQGSIWNGRINPVLGYRWDRTHSRFLRSNRAADGTWGEPFDPISNRGTLNGYANGGEPFRVETPTAGLSIAITDNLSVYGVYGEGIALSNVAQRDGLDRGFPPEFTRNREVGAKVSFWDGRISGRLTYFNLQKRGGVRYSFYAPNPSRGNFKRDEPITAAMLAGTQARPEELRRFMSFLGLYDMDTGTFNRLPLDLPGVERVFDANGRPFFIFPYGEVGNPGKYDPDTNTAPNGYGQDLLAYIQAARELEAAGIGTGSPQYMWSPLGNHPGEDRGAYHNFDEESNGWEARLQLRPVDNWQMILSYTYNTVEISNGLSGLVDPEFITGLEPWFWYLPPEDFADPTRPSTYQGNLSAGTRNTDVPVHSFTFWTKYDFTDGRLEGLDLRFGARYTSERAAEAPWAEAGGGFSDAIHGGLGDNTKADVPAYTLYDAGIGYKWQWKGLDWRFNVNIRNVFDKRRLTALSDRRTVGNLPEVTLFHLEGRDVRVSLRVEF
jgi:outer membrane receptor protein involved in Fe transport